MYFSNKLYLILSYLTDSLVKKTDSLRKKTNTGGKKTDKTEYTDSIEKKNLYWRRKLIKLIAQGRKEQKPVIFLSRKIEGKSICLRSAKSSNSSPIESSLLEAAFL